MNFDRLVEESSVFDLFDNGPDPRQQIQRLVRWAKERTHIIIEVVKRSPEQTGFAVIRRGWVVERTFAWIIKNRRFVRDYEQLTEVAETLIVIAATATLIRRWP